MIDFQSYSEASRLQTEALLSERFERVERAVRELPGSSAERQRIEDGWTADCPLCPWNKPTRFFITREGVLVVCPAGHDSVQINEETDALREAVETEAKAAEAEPFGIPVARLLAEQIPPIQWLVRGYVQEHANAVLAGPPGAGKTLLAFDWCAQLVAAGRRVFLAQNEGGKKALQDRLGRACAAAGLVPPPGTFRYERNLDLSLSNLGAVRALAEKASGNDLIVLDSLASFWPGLNENDPEHMSIVAEALKIMGEVSGAAIVGIHHTTKAAWKPDEKPSLADIRGHGSLGGRIDAAFICQPLERVEGVVRFELHVVKQRDEDWAPPRDVEIVMTGPAATLTISDKADHGGPGRRAKRTFDELKKAIMDYVRIKKPPPSGNQVENDIGGASATVKAAINELIEAKKLVRIGTAKTSRLAVLNTGSESDEL